MVNLSSTTLLFAIGGLALSVTTGLGIASADPDFGPIINSTCSYSQVMAALNAQMPDVAKELSADPAKDSWLRQLIASPPETRKVMLQQAGGDDQMLQVANTCNNY